MINGAKWFTSFKNVEYNGKSSDKVVECESRGGMYYFWYYEDLPNASAITLEQVTLKEE